MGERLRSIGRDVEAVGLRVEAISSGLFPRACFGLSGYGKGIAVMVAVQEKLESPKNPVHKFISAISALTANPPKGINRKLYSIDRGNEFRLMELFRGWEPESDYERNAFS